MMIPRDRIELFGGTAAIVRAFSNPHVARAVRRLLEFDIGRVIVVTDAVRDKGSTRDCLGNTLRDQRVQLIEMNEGYTWVNALNTALAAVRIENFSRKLRKKREFEFVLPISVEVNITEDVLRELHVSMRMVWCRGAVGVCFNGKQNGRSVNLGDSYGKPRNTCMLYRFAVFCELGYFDAWTDGIGGMEDMAFLLLMGIASKWEWLMLEDPFPQVELIVGVHYDQQGKEKREREAMAKIVVRYRGLVTPGPTQERLESELAHMGIAPAE